MVVWLKLARYKAYCLLLPSATCHR
jgi:hypothetical protein